MTVYIGVGANIDPLQNIRDALVRLADFVVVSGVSTFYVTDPLGDRDQPPYVNGVVQVKTKSSPLELRRTLKGIEHELGRKRSSDTYASRPIDLDIVLFGDLVIRTDKIRLPDPHLRDRPFLSHPIHELDPKVRIPDTQEPISQIAESAPTTGMKPLPDFSESLRRMIEP